MTAAVVPARAEVAVHLPDVRLGPVRARLDVLLVTVGIGVVSGLGRQDPVLGAIFAAAFAAVIFGHELGHAAVARLFGAPFEVVLQLTGGASYLTNLRGPRAISLTLLAGPAMGALTFGLGTLLTWQTHSLLVFGGHAVRYLSILWSGFQLLPFPPLDGGLLLRRVVLARLGSATLAWRLGWILGFTVVIGLLAFDLSWLEEVIWLTGMTVVLGRSEAGYVRHVDAYEAFERGEHADVVARVRRLPDYVGPEDQIGLRALGVVSALELEDVAAVEELTTKLPAGHAVVVRAAEWLLRQERGFGAKLAEQALDARAAERADRAVEPEHWADLAFQLAIHEARRDDRASALGLLEQAAELGFDGALRAEHEPSFASLRDQPRFERVLDRFRGRI